MISGDDYTLKYIDFGFATEKSNGYLTTFLGTPNYAAPELHLKQPYLGVYEDIFSLGVTLFIIVTGHLPFILPLPDDPLYQYIFCVDYINYWRNRKVKVSPSFMELFDNLIAFDPAQRPSISEIRKSKWMQEINWNLLPSLKQEFLRREENLKQKTLLYKNQAIIKNNNNNNIKNINVNNPNNMKKGDDMVNKIMEEKKEEFINDIKKKLFLMNNQKEENIITNNLTKEHNIINNNIINNKDHKLQGFIKIKICLKNLNSLIIILKQHLKNEGFNITKKDLDNLLIEISNGEVDILLTFEKMLKEIKINYIIINGNKDDFLNFKKIMKKLNITQA
jgi:serine/threonine protein kinase